MVRRRSRSFVGEGPSYHEHRLAVLYIHTATQSPLGADTWVHIQILKGLDRETHVVCVACAIGVRGSPTPTYAAVQGIPDLEVIPVDLGPELYNRTGLRRKLSGMLRTMPALPSLLKLAMLVRRRHIRIIHTSDRPRDAFAAVLLGRVTGATSIVHVHVMYSSWMGRLLTWSLGHADRLIAVSEFVAASLINAGIPADRVDVVHNAIDPTDWRPGEGGSEVRAELQIPDDAPVLVTVSRLFPEKGTVELLRALAVVRQKVPEVRLIIVGSDVTGGRFLAELERLVADLALGDAVRFLGRRSDVSRLMASADAYAMPSFEEPFGLVFVEAMAMRLPVVALANGGTCEIVEHGRTGLLSPPGDVDALAESILRLLGDPVLRAEMGAAGRTRVEEAFTTVRQSADVADLYARIVA